MLRNIVIVLLSFGASAGFGLVFGIELKRLPLAGLCGAISRIVLISSQTFIPNRVAYLFLSALAAGLLADVMATRTKTISTMYLYPAVVPLIPGDLLYYMITGFLIRDQNLAISNALEFVGALAGLGLGFSAVNIVRHYTIVRKRTTGAKSS